MVNPFPTKTKKPVTKLQLSTVSCLTGIRTWRHELSAGRRNPGGSQEEISVATKFPVPPPIAALLLNPNQTHTKSLPGERDVSKQICSFLEIENSVAQSLENCQAVVWLPLHCCHWQGCHGGNSPRTPRQTCIPLHGFKAEITVLFPEHVGLLV